MLDLNGYRNVWVLAEQRDGTIRNVTLELLGKGKELAEALNVELTAILLGSNIENQSQQLIDYGADKTICIESPQLENYQTVMYTDIIVRQIQKFKPEIFLIGATYLGRDLAPRIARRLGTGLTADCTRLEIDRETRLLVQTKPAYCGNLMASIITPLHRPQMATVRPRVMTSLDGKIKRTGEIIRVPPEIDLKQNMMLRILETVKEDKKSINLEEADIIVAVGRGIGTPAKIGVIQELAEVLGGEVGATRDIVDAGWISTSYQVGQTGKTVRPKLYIACGISGAIQHLAGMKESETIVAINKDPSAPIFQIADYGIVADLHQILPIMIRRIKQANTNYKPKEAK